ncbi:MAG: MoaD/ThiS family protein [Desulfobacteraceae bacterium]|nr:MAG: MoaD/ThiS family protein [Desulfobacteraceae bacterium]
MRVELKVFASLAKYAAHPLLSADGVVELPSPVSVGQIADALNIPRKEIKLIFLNGIHAQIDTAVKDGDRVGFFPPIGGG